MDEYIKRKMAIKAIKDCESADKFCVNEGLIIAMNALDDIPAADVRPVVRGKWVHNVPPRDLRLRCTVCNDLFPVRSNFCPNCGADMREES